MRDPLRNRWLRIFPFATMVMLAVLLSAGFFFNGTETRNTPVATIGIALVFAALCALLSTWHLLAFPRHPWFGMLAALAVQWLGCGLLISVADGTASGGDMGTGLMLILLALLTAILGVVTLGITLWEAAHRDTPPSPLPVRIS
jgi:hypothetical protein